MPFECKVCGETGKLEAEDLQDVYRLRDMGTPKFLLHGVLYFFREKKVSCAYGRSIFFKRTSVYIGCYIFFRRKREYMRCDIFGGEIGLISICASDLQEVSFLFLHVSKTFRLILSMLG